MVHDTPSRLFEADCDLASLGLAAKNGDPLETGR